MDDKFLTANIEDKMEQCEERYMVTNTAFLDMRQRSLAEGILRKPHTVKGVFWGGYTGADRCCLLFLPEYIDIEEGSEDVFSEYPEEEPLAAVRVSCSAKSRKLSHRDYLGSLMGLGIKRECIGDILVNETGADIVILKEICDFLLMNYGKAGNTYLTIEEIPLSEIKTPEIKLKEKTDTVASLRLDNLISSAFSISRTMAVNGIKGGLVFVNNLQIEKPDYQVKEGDILVFRGKGKAILMEVGGKSRKDRVFVRIGGYV